MKILLLFLVIFLLSFVSAIDYSLTDEQIQEGFEKRLYITDSFDFRDYNLILDDIIDEQVYLNFKDESYFKLGEQEQTKINFTNYYYSVGVWLIDNDSARIVIRELPYQEEIGDNAWVGIVVSVIILAIVLGVAISKEKNSNIVEKEVKK